MAIIKDKRAKKRGNSEKFRVIFNYTDTNGTYRKVERSVWGTKGDAKIVERQLEAEYGSKRTVPTSRMTVEELFNEYYAYHAVDTRVTTHLNTIKRLKKWVLPYFKDKRLDKLTRQDFANWKITINNEDLEYSTKQGIYKTFVAMLNYAVKMELIPKNDLSALGNFKNNGSLNGKKDKMCIYTAQEFEQYISAAKSVCKTITDWNYYVFFCIAFFTGARKGEIHALRWSDVDGNILHIRRSITQKLKTGDLETIPKNKSSIRDLQIPAPLMTVLNEHKQRQQEAAGDLFSENYRIYRE